MKTNLRLLSILKRSSIHRWSDTKLINLCLCNSRLFGHRTIFQSWLLAFNKKTLFYFLGFIGTIFAILIWLRLLFLYFLVSLYFLFLTTLLHSLFELFLNFCKLFQTHFQKLYPLILFQFFLHQTNNFFTHRSGICFVFSLELAQAKNPVDKLQLIITLLYFFIFIIIWAFIFCHKVQLLEIIMIGKLLRYCPKTTQFLFSLLEKFRREPAVEFF